MEQETRPSGAGKSERSSAISHVGWRGCSGTLVEPYRVPEVEEAYAPDYVLLISIVENDGLGRLDDS